MDIYGHLKPVTGGSDKSVRLWKVEKDTHLLFNRHTSAVDAVCALDQDRVVSGSQDGSLLLWSTASKKPQATGAVGAKNWVSALGAVRQCNAAFSGATDGTLQAWQFTRAKETDKEFRFVPAAEPVKAR